MKTRTDARKQDGKRYVVSRRKTVATEKQERPEGRFQCSEGLPQTPDLPVVGGQFHHSKVYHAGGSMVKENGGQKGVFQRLFRGVPGASRSR